jgi:hypothetical protein
MPAFDGVTSPSIAVQFLKSGTWTSVTISDVVQIDFRRGRERADLRDQAGFASIVFNNTSGIYDPDNTSASSPWVVSGASILRDGLQMRIVATWNSTAYPLFYGFLENNFTNQGYLPNVTMTFYDGIGYIADGFAPALATAANSETAATRVGRMLDYAGWTTGNGFSRSLTGAVTMLATVQNRGCMQAITEAIDSISGRFYISKSNVATLVPLADKFSRPTQLLFSDSGASNTVSYQDLITNPGTKYVVNQAIIMRGDNNQVTSTYNPSVTAYGVAKKEIFAPVNTDTNATNLALYESRKLAAPDTYIERIDFNGLVVAKNGLLYPDFLSTELADQVSVQRTTYDGRSLQWNLVVEGMKHTITQNNWLISFNTSDINPYSITI